LSMAPFLYKFFAKVKKIIAVYSGITASWEQQS